MKLSEKEFTELLEKNPKLKISSSIGGKSKISLGNEKLEKKAKISLLNSEEEENKKQKVLSTTDVKTINYENNNCIIQTSISDKHLTILFVGASLLSVNQIFNILQYRKYELFGYKKTWHYLVKKALENIKIENELPFFEEAVELTLFRQAPRLVDEDSMTTMFKYIIDGLKRTNPNRFNDGNPLGILKEDNPKIVNKINCFSSKGEKIVGIRIEKLITPKVEIKAKDLL